MRKPNPPIWTYEQLYELFEKQQKSTHEIAKELDAPQWKIRKALLFYGFKMRSKSEAGKILYDQGKMVSPTKGIKRSEEVKRKIGKTLSKQYEESSEEVKKERSERAKKQYNNMSQEEREQFILQGRKAIQITTKQGSKLERLVVDELTKRGYFCETQKTSLVPNEDLRVDIYLRDLNLAIEIDGPAHIENIYQDSEQFQKRQTRDREKNGLLTQFGYTVLRVKYIKKMSKTKMLDVFERILDIIEKLKTKEINDKLIFLEIDNGKEG